MKSNTLCIASKNGQAPGRHLKIKDWFTLCFLRTFFQYFCNLDVVLFRSQALRVISNLQDSSRDSITNLFKQTKKQFANLISKIPFFKKKGQQNSIIIKEKHITHVNFILYFHPHYQIIPEANLDPDRLRLLDTLTQDFINFVNDYCQPNVQYYYPSLFPLDEMPPNDINQLGATLIETNNINLNTMDIIPMPDIPNYKQSQNKDDNNLTIFEAIIAEGLFYPQDSDDDVDNFNF